MWRRCACWRRSRRSAKTISRQSACSRECLKLAPGYSHARFDLARLLYSQQKADPILPLLERLLALDPNDLRYRSLQASAYALLGQNDLATRLLSALISEFPNNENAVAFPRPLAADRGPLDARRSRPIAKAPNFARRSAKPGSASRT